MRQQFTLGIHPHGTLVGASLIGLEIETEGVEVALVLDKREWQYLVDGDVIGWIVVKNYKLQANCVLQPLLVDGVGDGLRLTGNTVLQRADVALCHTDAVPTLGHDFLPTSNFLGKFVVIGMQFTGAGSQFLIELRVIVIQLTLHRIVRRNGCDGILHHLHPVG